MSRLERIVAACGGEVLEGGRRAVIPGPGHSSEDRSVSLLETDDGRILVYCFSPQDDWRSVRQDLERRGLLAPNTGELAGSPLAKQSFEGRAHNRKRRERTGERLMRAKKFWDEARPLGSTLADRYLSARGIGQCSSLTALRFHPSMTSLEDRQHRPALLSQIVNSDGDLQGIEITLICADGQAKARLKTPRRVVGE
jgi:hypothetical protein